jgi:hypothetical protein
MRNFLFWTGIIVLPLLVPANADERVEREKLFGSWQLQGGPIESPAAVWIFTASGGDLTITQLAGEKVITKFQCATNGSTCKVKTGDDKGTISMWYNGAKLVQMETKGSTIIKRRFAVLAPGNVMEVEFVPIVPDGKPEILRFQRLQVSDQNK